MTEPTPTPRTPPPVPSAVDRPADGPQPPPIMTGRPPLPIAYASYGPSYAPLQPPVNPTARRLVNWSHALGWGGLALLLLGSPVAIAVSRQPLVGGLVAGLGLLSAVVGAVLGQIGRAMQGRVV